MDYFSRSKTPLPPTLAPIPIPVLGQPVPAPSVKPASETPPPSGEKLNEFSDAATTAAGTVAGAEAPAEPEQDGEIQTTEKENEQDEPPYSEASDTPAEIELSLCGHRIYQNDQEDIAQVFEEGKVSYEEYSNDPLSILENPNLLIRFEDKLYEWKAAAPLILSLLAYKKPLPYEIMKQLTSGKKPPAKKVPEKPPLPLPSPPKRARILSKSPSPPPELVDPSPTPKKLHPPHSNPETPNLKADKPLHVMIEELNLGQEPLSGPDKEKVKAVQNFLHTREPSSDQLKALCDFYA